MTGSVWTDPSGVTRYGSLDQLPYIPLLCLVLGHAWSDPPDEDGTSRFRCDRGCGREKVETQDVIGVVQWRTYSGGTMLAVEARPLRNEARAELRRRKRRTAQQARAVADASADLEMRAALEQHRAQHAVNGSR